MRHLTKESAGAAPGGLPESIHQTTPPETAIAGKALAVWRYCIDARGPSATRAVFARHPEWVSA
jgi:hypothetical protein